MKKFKFFALTALFCAMGTNAFAFTEDGKSATKLFTFAYDQTAKEAIITGFVSELDDEFKAGLSIPATVTDPVNIDSETKKNFVYDVVEIAAEAFKDQPVSTVSFFTPAAGKKGIVDIGEGAFKGTKIAKLDLSNTKITYVRNLFGTKIDWDGTKDNGVANTTLKSVKLPGTWEHIVAKAFENCTALATIDFGTATASSQAFDCISVSGDDYYNNFAGCPLTALDFTGTKVTFIPEGLLFDGEEGKPAPYKFASNASLKTVTLTDKIAMATFTAAFANCTALTAVNNLEKTSVIALTNSAFKGDAALTTINTTKITNFGISCFEGCAALTTVSLKAATISIGSRAFAGCGLTSVEFPAENLFQIQSEAFFECANLTKVTFGLTSTKTSDMYYIGQKAFAYTGITEFEIPATKTDMEVYSMAFAGTPIKSFTWQTTGGYDGSSQFVAVDVFTKCSDVVFYAQQSFISKWQSVEGEEAPYNSTFSPKVVDKSKAFTQITAYNNNPNKFYVKWYSTSESIAIKKGEGKVYAGFLEGDWSLGLIQHKADPDGYIQIAPNEAVIIITENSELKYLPGDGSSTSWMGISLSYLSDQDVSGGFNALKYCEAATTRGTLETNLTDDTYYIYGWVNGSKGTGFQKITSGTNIPKGTLFAFAKEPVAGARMTIKWYDENGNLEGETTAIDAIENVATEAEGETYNLAGQKVNAAYKGVIVKNGKKLIRK